MKKKNSCKVYSLSCKIWKKIERSLKVIPRIRVHRIIQLIWYCRVRNVEGRYKLKSVSDSNNHFFLVCRIIPPFFYCREMKYNSALQGGLWLDTTYIYLKVEFIENHFWRFQVSQSLQDLLFVRGYLTEERQLIFWLPYLPIRCLIELDMEAWWRQMWFGPKFLRGDLLFLFQSDYEFIVGQQKVF